MQEFINEVAEIALKKKNELKQLSAQNLELDIDFAVLEQEIQDAKYLINAIIDEDKKVFKSLLKTTTSNSIYESITKHVPNIELELGPIRYKGLSERGKIAMHKLALSKIREAKK